MSIEDRSIDQTKFRIMELLDFDEPTPATITVMSDFSKADRRVKLIGLPEIDFEDYQR